MSREEIAATVNTITGLIGALTYAPAADKAEIYAGLRLRLTLQPGQPGPQNGDHASRNRPGMYERGGDAGHRPTGRTSTGRSAEEKTVLLVGRPRTARMAQSAPGPFDPAGVPLVRVSVQGTPRWREDRGGLAADVGTRLGREPASPTGRRPARRGTPLTDDETSVRAAGIAIIPVVLSTELLLAAC
jgi:hypothetical protein